MKPAAVIFDWAGTMIDFGSLAPVFAMRAAFASEGVALSEADIRAGMGLAKRDHVRACLIGCAPAWRAAHGRDHDDADVDRIYAALAPMLRDAGAARATLIPGAADTAAALTALAVPIGSTTGYTREMMSGILPAAAAQGYAPAVVVCAGETRLGRPSPLMIWKALAELEVWPAAATVKVDDAPAGIAEGVAAGCFTVGLAASGNALGLDLPDYAALAPADRAARLDQARAQLLAAGADLVIDTVAELLPALRAAGRLDDGG